MAADKPKYLQKIISGGQIGADQEALRAAFYLGIVTGGWAPKSFMTSSGPMIDLKTKYNLKEIRESVQLPLGYIIRSQRNVDDSDATVAFKDFSIEGTGTDKTIGYCMTGKWKTCDFDFVGKPYKPIMVISIDDIIEKNSDFKKQLVLFARFIIDNDVKILNVCGNRRLIRENIVYDFLIIAYKFFI